MSAVLKRTCCNRPSPVVLKPGDSLNDLGVIKGAPKFCMNCGGLIEARVGDEYRNGRALVTVVRNCGRVGATASYHGQI